MEVKLKLSLTKTSQMQVLKNLAIDDQFYDCGLMTEGIKINGHRIVLAHASQYIKDILKNVKTPGTSVYPILIFENIKIEILQLMVELAYLHEVNVKPNQVEEFFTTLNFFKVNFCIIESLKLPSRSIETLPKPLPMKISLVPARSQSPNNASLNEKTVLQEQNAKKKLMKSKSMYMEREQFPRFMKVNFAEQRKIAAADLREIDALKNRSTCYNFK